MFQVSKILTPGMVLDFYSQFPWRFFEELEVPVVKELLTYGYVPSDPRAQEVVEAGQGGMKAPELSTIGRNILPSPDRLSNDEMDRRLRDLIRRSRRLHQQAYEIAERLRQLKPGSSEFSLSVVEIRAVLMALGTMVASEGVLLAGSRFSGAMEYVLFGLLRRYDPRFQEYAVSLCSLLKLVPIRPEGILFRMECKPDRLEAFIKEDHFRPYDSWRVREGVYLPKGLFTEVFCSLYDVSEAESFFEQSVENMVRVRNGESVEASRDFLKDAVHHVATLVGMLLEHGLDAMQAATYGDFSGRCHELLIQIDREVGTTPWVDGQGVAWAMWLPILRHILTMP